MLTNDTAVTNFFHGKPHDLELNVCEEAISFFREGFVEGLSDCLTPERLTTDPLLHDVPWW